MKKALRFGLMLAALAAVSAAPLSGHAVHEGTSVECSDTASGGSGACATTFDLSEAGFVSILESHGNFHDLAPSEERTVTVQWFDGAETLVYSSRCTITGLSADGVGPLDLQNATCDNETHEITYAAGQQVLLVTAEGDGLFHGQLVISAQGSLI